MSNNLKRRIHLVTDGELRGNDKVKQRRRRKVEGEEEGRGIVVLQNNRAGAVVNQLEQSSLRLPGRPEVVENSVIKELDIPKERLVEQEHKREKGEAFDEENGQNLSGKAASNIEEAERLSEVLPNTPLSNLLRRCLSMI